MACPYCYSSAVCNDILIARRSCCTRCKRFWDALPRASDIIAEMTAAEYELRTRRVEVFGISMSEESFKQLYLAAEGLCTVPFDPPAGQVHTFRGLPVRILKGQYAPFLFLTLAKRG